MPLKRIARILLSVETDLTEEIFPSFVNDKRNTSLQIKSRNASLSLPDFRRTLTGITSLTPPLERKLYNIVNVYLRNWIVELHKIATYYIKALKKYIDSHFLVQRIYWLSLQNAQQLVMDHNQPDYDFL